MLPGLLDAYTVSARAYMVYEMLYGPRLFRTSCKNKNRRGHAYMLRDQASMLVKKGENSRLHTRGVATV